MARPLTSQPRPACPNPECPESRVILNGSLRGRKRYLCHGCGTYFGETEGTPRYDLKTPVKEIAAALLMVMRRGSLRGAEDATGHKYETIGKWLRLAAAHAEILTDCFAKDLQIEQGEIDEFWSFVLKKLPLRRKPTLENDGDVSFKIAPAVSLWRTPTDESEMNSSMRPSCKP
jgi:transposase-like protein